MRRIVVTGARSPLARHVISALRAIPTVDTVCGVENRKPAASSGRPAHDDAFIKIVPFAPDHRPFVEYLEKESIDTVVQCGLVPDRVGLAMRSVDADVISTMCLGAAIGHEQVVVRNWVVASSSAAYPIGSHSPLLQRESQSHPLEDQPLASSIAEAEEYARDLAVRLPHVNVSILRLQQLIGPGVHGPLAALLACDPTPAPIGFDPAIQLLHLDDAASAIAYAAQAELAGLYNVASAGTIRWDAAVAVAGSTKFPVLPVRLALLEPLLKQLHVPFLPSELHDLMLFGHAVDTQKIERAGWKPQYDQHACLSSVR
jgi:UDP-glucose 4-epimerase